MFASKPSKLHQCFFKESSTNHQWNIKVSEISTLKKLMINNVCVEIINVSSMLHRCRIVVFLMDKPVFFHDNIAGFVLDWVWETQKRWSFRTILLHLSLTKYMLVHIVRLWQWRSTKTPIRTEFHDNMWLCVCGRSWHLWTPPKPSMYLLSTSLCQSSPTAETTPWCTDLTKSYRHEYFETIWCPFPQSRLVGWKRFFLASFGYLRFSLIKHG